ncbi:oligosaccharide flippase family protein [Piscinibacter sp.]|uniref:oligosaccharide flippase family protein n=1 Tax=Piscinibacter sp. TaxID=1903157 RepID=UPI0035B0E48E
MPAASASAGLLRASLTLLAGGAAAQLVPLLLGPWLTRLYTPEAFGLYHLLAAVAANLAVVACARYEFALPLVADDAQAAALRSLCLRLIGMVAAATALAGAAWAWWAGAAWPLWLGPAVAVLALFSLATLNATRAQRFRPLAWARVLQHGGAALLQGLAGLLAAGVHGLIAGPVLAAGMALAALGWPGPARATAAERRAVAQAHRDFPLLNTPHAFLGALQDTLAVALVAASQGAAGAGAWGLALRYLKAPATLVGSAVSQALYPQLAKVGCTRAGRALVVRTMALLALIAAPLVLLLWLAAPAAFAWAFGAQWRGAGELGRALSLYIGMHFVASPLSVVTLAWNAQAWALKLALIGQAAFVIALAAGLALDGLRGAGWAVSLAMALYFGWYFLSLARWPVEGA